ncbi:conserved hypothetical protein [Histoplasma capsulatum G186AR]|uniref:Uncharacterized protein n=1 Tax=Ajellomyces capsulatus (strain G186AR / H82 / ATCC MYA-2454 / RMSCC 2432) TaxID=447093 RepID=C0NLR9_AJECG|nr:uncharacterized protein HCBG_04449 [Histoplasma capsulatum G186AR]EEH07570.1 conserved hypothetical protein [Histoplasma capsulatum G186AR]
MLRYWARERNEDGKSFRNPQHGILSKAYEEFPDPLEKGHRGGFDIHIYHYQNNPDQVNFAKALWQRIRHECNPQAFPPAIALPIFVLDFHPEDEIDLRG